MGGERLGKGKGEREVGRGEVGCGKFFVYM